MNSKFLATSQLIPLPFRIFSALLFTVFDALAGGAPSGWAEVCPALMWVVAAQP